jgi:hypothetical protein
MKHRECGRSVIPRISTKYAVDHFIVLRSYDLPIRLSKIERERGFVRQEVMGLEDDEFVLSEPNRFVQVLHTLANKLSGKTPCRAKQAYLQFPYITSSFCMPRCPYTILSRNDVGVLVQGFLRAGYSEHRIFVHRGVKRRVHCRNNE